VRDFGLPRLLVCITWDDVLSVSVYYLGYCLVCQGVHPHGYLEIIQIVQELAEVLTERTQ
jgi:hypothetical protein